MMKNQDINVKFHASGVLMMLDSPKGLQFGIDNISWQIGIMFKGLKMIPLGIHYVTYSLKQQNYMLKQCRFINFTKENRIYVYKWNSMTSLFMQLKGQQADGYKHGVKKYYFDSYLGVYPEQNLPFWNSNTTKITPEVLSKLDPVEKIEVFDQQYDQLQHQQQPQINQFNEQRVEDIHEQQVDQQAQIQQKKGSKQVKKFKDLLDTIYYSNIPKRLKADLSSISKVNMDKSQILQYVINRHWKNNKQGILGQIQYSFISFLIGQDQQSFSQWKQLLDLFCSSEQLFTKDQQLMLQFLTILYQQILQFPIDFFNGELSKENFMHACLKKLRLYEKQQTIPKRARKRVKKLLQLVQDRFTTKLQCENEDELPLVVQENQSYF